MDKLIKRNKLLEIKNEQLEAKIQILEKHIDEYLSLKIDTTSYNEGMIRSNDGIKCYHGIQPHEATWSKDKSKYNHLFWVYDNCHKWNSGNNNGKWDIKENELQKFCNHYELDIEFSKRKRTHKVYRCLGHNINTS